MSNYASRPIDYGHAIDTSAIDLFGKVATIKQGRYDTNYDLVQQTLNQYGSLANSLVQPAAKEYLAGKLQEVTNTVNNSADTDLSRNGVKNKLLSQVKNVLNDKRVQNDFIDNSNYQNYQRTIAEKKEKHPELYNTANDAYAQTKAGVTDWMSDTTGTKRLGSLNYIDYTDYNKTFQEYAKNLDKYADVVKESHPDGTQYFISRDGKRLTQQQIESQIGALLTDKEKAQMQVDGWAKFENGKSIDQTKSDFSTFAQNKLKSVQDDIIQTEAMIGNSTDDNEINRLTAEVNAKKQYLSDLSQNYSGVLNSGDSSNMSFQMQYNNVLGNFSKAFAFDNVGTSYSVDSSAVEKMKEQFKLLTGSKKDDTNADGIADVRAVGLPYVGTDQNFLETVQASATAKQGSYTTTVETAYNQLPKLYKDAIDTQIKNHPEKDRTDILHKYIENLAQGSSNVVSLATARALDQKKAAAEEDQNTYVDAMTQAAAEQINEVAPKLVEGYLNNPDVKIIQTNGTAVSGAAYFAKNGIKTAADLETPKGNVVKEQLVKTYLADKMLSESDNRVGINTYGGLPIPTKLKSNPQESPLFAVFRGQFNTEKEANDFLENARKRGTYDTNSYTDTFANLLGFTPAAIAGVMSNAINKDNSITDDATLNDALTIDAIKARASRLVANKKIDTRQNGFEIQPKTEIHSSLINAAGNTLIATDGSQFVANPAGVITVKESANPDAVEITQTQQRTVDKNQVFVPVTAVILKQNLPPQILNAIDFANQGKVFKNSNIPEISVPAKPISKNDVKRIEDLDNNLLYGQAINYTKEAMSKEIFNKYSTIIGSAKQPNEMGVIVDQVIENTNNLPPLQVKLKKDNTGKVYTSIVYKKGNYEKNIYTSTRAEDENNLDTTYSLVKYAPQVFIKQLVETMLQDEMAYPNGKNEIFENLKSAYAGQ